CFQELSALLPKADLLPDLRTAPAASFSRMPPSLSRASTRSRVRRRTRTALAGCDLKISRKRCGGKRDAARVISFFRGFLQEEAAAGQHGQAQAGSRKPIYTRAQITARAAMRRKAPLVMRTGPLGRSNSLRPAARGASPAL